MNSDRILGFVLIGIGAVLLLGVLTDIGGEMVPGLIGLAFLAAYVRTRAYGFLVPGGILTGLGTGLVLDGQGVAGDVVPLGLGLGFLAIAVVGRFAGEDWPGWWWPLIPGGILTVVGTSGLAESWDVGRYVLPAVLIVIGLSLLLRRSGDRPADRDPSRDQPPRPAIPR
ncbi:MAG TPA: hypothetical protein VK906_00355 [Egicoccus sp.]|nr:hypothetical protein [Egicoccus sp.]HSK21591.1 hypothetical protein [Egicoccus sp.]